MKGEGIFENAFTLHVKNIKQRRNRQNERIYETESGIYHDRPAACRHLGNDIRRKGSNS